MVARLARAHGVVNVFPATELRIELRDVRALWDRLIALFLRSAGYPSPCMCMATPYRVSPIILNEKANGSPFGTESVGGQLSPTATKCHKCLKVNSLIISPQGALSCRTRSIEV